MSDISKVHPHVRTLLHYYYGCRNYKRERTKKKSKLFSPYFVLKILLFFKYLLMYLGNGISRHNAALISNCVFENRSLVNLELVNL